MDLSHRKAFELLQRSIDGPLDAGERAKLERHLAICAECQTYAALQRRLKKEALAHHPMALPSQKEIERTIRETQKRYRRWRMFNRLFVSPVRAAAWAAVAVALTLAVIWIFGIAPGQNQTGSLEVTRIVKETVIQEEVVPTATPQERDAAFYERWSEALLAAWHEGDVDALDEFYAQDFVNHDPPYLDLVGLRTVKQAIVNTRSAYPEVHFAFEGAIYLGDFLARWSTFQRTTSGDEKETLVSCAWDRWEGKKLVEAWNYTVLVPPDATTVPAGPSVPIGEKPESAERDEAFYERWDEVWLAAWNDGELDALDEFVAQDYVRHQVNLYDAVGLQGLKDFIAHWRDTYADVQVTYDARIAQGDFAAARGTRQGTDTTGEKDTDEWCSISRWEGKKLVEEWVIAVTVP